MPNLIFAKFALFDYSNECTHKKGGFMDDLQPLTPEQRKSSEFRLFVFIIVFLFPILAVAVVGGYGFLVWMSQIFMGPPGPPGG